MTRRRFTTAAGVVGLYLVLVGVLTWPLAARIATHLPDTHEISSYDPLYTAWVLAWESHALVTGVPIADPNIYHPARGTFFFSDTAFGALPVFMPVFLASGNPTLALNVLFVFGVVFTAAAVHLVAFRWTRSHGAAFVGGWMTLMTPWSLWTFDPTAPSEGLLLYLPFIVLLATAARPPVLPLVVLAVLQSLTDVAYVAAATIGPLLILAAPWLVQRATRPAGARLLVVAVLATLALLPIHLQHLAVHAANPGLATQTVWVHPTRPLVLPWGPFQQGPMAAPVAAFALVAIAAGFRLRARPPLPGWAPAMFWTVVGLLISLPPTAMWHGRLVSLPPALLAAWTPLYDLLRVPIRLGVAGFIGLALLAGVACAECCRHVPVRLRALVPFLAAVAMFVPYARAARHLPGQYPLVPAADDPAPLLALLRRPGGPLLDIPVGTRGDWDPSNQARATFRSTRHWRPLLNGYSSYWPAGFPERMELAKKLPDPGALAQLRAETGLELVLVHLDEFSWRERRECRRAGAVGANAGGECAVVGAAERARWENVANDRTRTDLRLVARTEDALLFSVPRATSD